MCGCKKRFEKLEQGAPRVAKAIKPAHKLAMRMMDKLAKDARAGGTPKRRVIGSK
jgi:hypothetical protein